MCRGSECRGECCVSMLKYFMHAKEVKYKILNFTFYLNLYVTSLKKVQHDD